MPLTCRTLRTQEDPEGAGSAPATMTLAEQAPHCSNERIPLYIRPSSHAPAAPGSQVRVVHVHAHAEAGLPQGPSTLPRCLGHPARTTDMDVQDPRLRLQRHLLVQVRLGEPHLQVARGALPRWASAAAQLVAAGVRVLGARGRPAVSAAQKRVREREADDHREVEAQGDDLGHGSLEDGEGGQVRAVRVQASQQRPEGPRGSRDARDRGQAGEHEGHPRVQSLYSVRAGRALQVRDGGAPGGRLARLELERHLPVCDEHEHARAPRHGGQVHAR
mmetsp:Transcript_80558/g.249968  ORF Transcript_80558/g.249968 Transcript_80558/m.249968 type:complete len:275 (-) Transcript_80558:1360-2184(-)